MKQKDTMGMNSPTKGKKLSDGTSADHIVISTTKSFQAKIVMNPVHTNVSKQPNQLSGKKSQKKAEKSNVDKHIKLGDELFGAGIQKHSPSKVIAFDFDEADEKINEHGSLRVKELKVHQDSNTGLRDKDAEIRGSDSTFAYTRAAGATGSTGDEVGLSSALLGVKHNYGEHITEHSEEASHMNIESVMRQRGVWSNSGMGKESATQNSSVAKKKQISSFQDQFGDK